MKHWSAVHAGPQITKQQVRRQNRRGGPLFLVREDKSAGQSTCTAGPPLKGGYGVNHPMSTPPPSRAVATDQPPDDPLDDSTPEPTDEELWLEETARQVEADARPGLRPRPRLPLSAEPSNSTTTEPPT